MLKRSRDEWKTHLGAKFSLLLILVCLFGGLGAIGIFSQHLNRQAEQAVSERAEIVLTATQAARNYTQNMVQPLLQKPGSATEEFIQAIVPNFAAREIFNDFRKQNPDFQDFSYRETTPNPTNPEDRSDAFETQIFNQLKHNPEMRSGYRQLANGNQQFYLARPIIMSDTSCLACHGRPSDAPKSMVKMYGATNGFGWQLNDVVAAQIVSVPADRILAQGRASLITVTKILASIFAALFIVINLLLWRTVIRPLTTLIHVAEQISDGSEVPSESDPGLLRLTQRRDEPGQLARSFQYMIHVLSRREQDLQQAVQERTQSLEQEMRDRQVAQDALQTYSHAMNHDLRNLTMGISILVQGILFQNKQALQHKSATDRKIAVEPTALEMIQKSCDRQINLMDALYEVKSTNVWELELNQTPINLRQLTQELVATYSSKLTAAQAQLENQIPEQLPLISADVSQLQRVFDNLVDNALKYNRQGLNIRFDARVIDQNYPPMLRCTVTDDGIGVPPDQQSSIFGMYDRGQTTHKVSGHGLGLYICRKIIEAHGGEVGVETASNGGAEFWFTLPLLTADAAA